MVIDHPARPQIAECRWIELAQVHRQAGLLADDLGRALLIVRWTVRPARQRTCKSLTA